MYAARMCTHPKGCRQPISPHEYALGDPEISLPAQVYKMHLVEGRAPTGPAVDSARANLASTFVNAFVNAGFGQDKLMTVNPEGDATDSVHWIFKNKDHGTAAEN